MINHAKETTQLKILDQDKIKHELEEVRSNKSSKNWILMGYEEGKKNDLRFEASGEGGFEKVKTYLKDEDIKYAVFEVVVKGDQYNPVKYVLLTWIGENVPPGLAKARCSTHRQDLLKFITSCIAISAEFQPPTRHQLTSEEVAAKVTKTSQQDATSADAHRQTMSRSHASQGDTKASKVQFNKTKLVPALKSVHEGKNRWVVMGYVGRDDIDLVATGKGDISELLSHWNEESINFAVYALTFTPRGTTEKTTKYVLITMVGDHVKPLAKARSSGQRQDIADFVLASLPFHTHFQPTDKTDLNEKNLLSKLD
eukprot:TRINITY_DN5052_c0_g1_i4.p1 TRINITY_DN5052_c0_g1~~TRINITY_DN5052_c0_g1_i4.p1  ORF type:complete len:312 (-),score=64.83 TRINITY_DN5052_c0_g1_i4:11-946(-)